METSLESLKLDNLIYALDLVYSDSDLITLYSTSIFTFMNENRPCDAETKLQL